MRFSQLTTTIENILKNTPTPLTYMRQRCRAASTDFQYLLCWLRGEGIDNWFGRLKNAISGEGLRSSRPRGSTYVDYQRQGPTRDIGRDGDAAVLVAEIMSLARVMGLDGRHGA